MEHNFSIALSLALIAAVLKFLGDMLEVFSKTDDMDRAPKTVKRLLAAKSVVTWLATAIAMWGAVNLLADWIWATASIAIAAVVVMVIGLRVMHTATAERNAPPVTA